MTTNFVRAILAAMTFKQAVRKLGGPSGAAKAGGIPRTTLVHWLKCKEPPKWRQAEVDKIIELAKAA